jgi:hypothetical protein
MSYSWVRSYLVSRRLKKEWGAFQAQFDSSFVDTKGTDPLNAAARGKLAIFLKDFDTSHSEAYGTAEHTEVDHYSADAMYGDCETLLLNLTTAVLPRLAQTKRSNLKLTAQNRANQDEEEELVLASLRAVDIVLIDPKYVELSVTRVVDHTMADQPGYGPYVVNALIHLLHRLSRVRAKTAVLRIINRIAEVGDNRLLVRGIKGFDKVLKLLKSGDDGMSEEILRTIKIFFLTPNNVMGTVSSDDAPGQTGSPPISDTPGGGGGGSDAGSTAASPSTVSMTERVMSELGRFAPWVRSGWGSFSGNDKTSEGGLPDPIKMVEDEVASAFPPSKETLEASVTLARAKIRLYSEDPQSSADMLTDGGTEPIEEEDREALAMLTGVLQMFGEKLSPSKRALEVLLTTHLFLIKSHAAHELFLSRGGYGTLEQLPDHIAKGPHCAAEKHELIIAFFKIMLAMTLRAEYTANGIAVAAHRATVLPGQDEDTFLVENIRALNVIANILKGSNAPEITLFAVQCLYNIVSVNPRNVVFLLELDIHTDVLNILKIPAQALVGENVDAVLALMREADLLLRYLFVLSGTISNQTILRSYITLFHDSHKYSRGEMEGSVAAAKHISILLEGISGMMSDCHHRGICLDMDASPSFLEFLKLQLRFVRRRMTLRRDEMPGLAPISAPSADTLQEGGVTDENEIVDIVAKSVLVTLEILALLILRDAAGEYDAFHAVQGWRLILDVIQAGSDFARAAMTTSTDTGRRRRGQPITASTMQQPVSELALWLLRELVLIGARRDEHTGGGGIAWVVRLLREAWPTTTLDLLQPGTATSRQRGASKTFGAGAYADLSAEDSGDDEDEDDVWAHTGTAAGTSSLRLALLQAVTLLFSRQNIAKKKKDTQVKDGRFLDDHHVDAVGHAVPLLHVQIPQLGKAHGAQVPVGHCASSDTLSALRVAFCKHGGVLFLLNLSRQGQNLFDTTRRAAVTNKKRMIEAKCAFQALGAALSDCEANKRFIEEEVGFVEFANMLSGSSIELTQSVFNIILDLGLELNGDLSSVLMDDDVDAGHSTASVAGSAPLSLSLLSTVRRVLFPEPLWETHVNNIHLIAPRDRRHGTSGSNASGSKHDSEADLYQESPAQRISNLSETMLSTAPGSIVRKHSSAPSSAGSDASSGSYNAFADVFERVDLLNAVDRAVQQKETFEQNQTAGNIVRRQRSGTVKFRSTEAALMPIMLLPAASIETQEMVVKRLLKLVSMNPSNSRAFCDMRVPSFILCIVHKIPDEVQQYYLELVAKLMLYHINVDDVYLLLRLALIRAEETADMARVSLHQLPEDERPPAEDIDAVIQQTVQRREELQMQIYYIIGCAVERTGPSSYFHFDGSRGAIKSAPLTDFPPASVGFTVSCWLKLHPSAAQQFSFFRLTDNDGVSVLELFFTKANALSKAARQNGHVDQRYFLCLRTWRCSSLPGAKSGNIQNVVAIKVFDDYQWSSFGDKWHHLMLSQNKDIVRVFVDGNEINSNWLLPKQGGGGDGRDVQKSLRTTFYPRARSKSRQPASRETPLRAFIGGTRAHRGDGVSQEQDPSPSPGLEPLQSSNLSGQVGSISLFHGSWSGDEARRLYEQGAAPEITPFPPSTSKTSKTVFSIQPAQYADSSMGRGVRVWRSGSLSATYTEEDMARGRALATPPRSNQTRTRSLTIGNAPKFMFSGPDLSQFVISASFEGLSKPPMTPSPARSHTLGRRPTEANSSPMGSFRRKRSSTDPFRDEAAAGSLQRKRPSGTLSVTSSTAGSNDGDSSVDASPTLEGREFPDVFIGMDYNIQQSAEIIGSVEAHLTHSFHDITAYDRNVMNLLCGMLDIGVTHQIATLRILTGLIQHSKHFFGKFQKLRVKDGDETHRGIQVVCHLLVKNKKTWSIDTFLPLLEILAMVSKSEDHKDTTGHGTKAYQKAIFRILLDLIHEIDLHNMPGLFDDVIQLIADKLLSGAGGLQMFRSHNYGQSTVASGVFIVVETMLTVQSLNTNLLKPPPKVVRVTSFLSGNPNSLVFDNAASSPPSPLLGAREPKVEPLVTQATIDAVQKSVLASCCRVLVAILNCASAEEPGPKPSQDEISAISDLLGFEPDSTLFGVESWSTVKAEVSKTLVAFIVDSPSALGFHVADMLRAANPEFPWQTAFQLMAVESSEEVRLHGIQLLSTLLTVPHAGHSLHSTVTKLRLQFETSFGYASMLSILRGFPVTKPICMALLDLTVEKFAPQWSSASSSIKPAENMDSSKVVNPGALRVLLHLLKLVAYDAPQLVSLCMRTVERLISPDLHGSETAAKTAVHNLDALLACQGEQHPLGWFLDFIAHCETQTFAQKDRVREDSPLGGDRSSSPSSIGHSAGSIGSYDARPGSPSLPRGTEGGQVMDAEAARGEKYGFSLGGGYGSVMNSPYSPALSAAESFDGESLSSFSLGGGGSDHLDSKSSTGQGSMSMDYFESIHAIIRRMILHDFCKPWKKHGTSALFTQLLHMASSNEWVEASAYNQVHFVAAVLDDLLDEIERSPRLPFSPSVRAFSQAEIIDSSATTNTLKNFATFLDGVFERLENSTIENTAACDNLPTLISKAVAVIKRMTAHNRDERLRMKDTMVFSVRDNLVLYCLSNYRMSNWRIDQRVETMLNVSSTLEIVSAEANFVALGGMVNLTHLFFDIVVTGADEDHSLPLQHSVAKLMRTVLGASEANRRELVRVIQDSTILEKLLPALGLPSYDFKAVLASQGAWLGSWRSRSSSTASLSGISADIDARDIAEFIQWFLNHCQSKEEAMNRILKNASAVYKRSEDNRKKTSTRITKYVRNTVTMDTRHSANMEKKTTENESIWVSRQTMGSENARRRLTEESARRMGRLDDGLKSWKTLSASTRNGSWTAGSSDVLMAKESVDPWEIACGEDLSFAQTNDHNPEKFS